MTVTVVVPTRNRPGSLDRTLRALARQTRPADEVIVVDASDGQHAAGDRRHGARDGLPARLVLAAEPGVCAQRNRGIAVATGELVLLCDDDVEPNDDYLERLVAHMARHPECGAVTGVIVEPDGDGAFGPPFPTPSLRHLLFAFVFQTSVMGAPTAPASGPPARIVSSLLAAWYRRRGNRWSLAGWPLVTSVGEDVARVSTYGLGAALVRRDWLLAAPFDETLGPHGIGDNYGVALRFPGDRPVHLLTRLRVRHHHEATGRLSEPEAVRLRALALDRFMTADPRFSVGHRAVLVWSLLGQSALLAMKGRPSAGPTLRAAWEIAAGTNPLRHPAPPLGAAHTARSRAPRADPARP